MNDMYPYSFFKSKLFPWYLNKVVEASITVIMLPKVVLDTYVTTFKSVYRTN